MSRLLDLYTKLLKFANLRVDEEGVVHHPTSKKEKITNHFVQGKPLVLPTYEQLSQPDIAERLVFHPFAESSGKGESTVVAELRHRICHHLSIRFCMLLTQMIQLGASPKEHKRLNPIQAELLSVIKDANERTSEVVLALCNNIIMNPAKKEVAPIQIYLSRQGKVKGRDYARAGIVSFPLYSTVLEELDKTKDRSVAGVKINEKDLRLLKGAIEYIFPGIDKDLHAYDQGSSSDVAPYIDALMRTAAGLQIQLNERARLFEDINDFKAVILEEDWADAIEELPSLLTQIKSIPFQPGMDGTTKVAETQAERNRMQDQQPQHQQRFHPHAAPVPPQYAAPTQQSMSAHYQPVQNTASGIDPGTATLTEEGKIRLGGARPITNTAMMQYPQVQQPPGAGFSPFAHGGQFAQNPQPVFNTGFAPIAGVNQPFGSGFGQPAHNVGFGYNPAFVR